MYTQRNISNIFASFCLITPLVVREYTKGELHFTWKFEDNSFLGYDTVVIGNYIYHHFRGTTCIHVKGKYLPINGAA
jgi:hypothetical protein